MPALDAHRIFLSTVTSELGRYRTVLAQRFERVSVKTVCQEEFEYANTDLVEKLYKLYKLIEPCDVVIHFVGAGAGAKANPKAVTDFLSRCEHRGQDFLGYWKKECGLEREFFDRLSYTQWEAIIAFSLGKHFMAIQPSGPVTEAVEPMGVTLEINVASKLWENVAVVASNLSELEVTLGRVEQAVADARRSIEFADRSGDAFQRISKRATAADALHQSGEREEAHRLFDQAEALQREDQPGFALLYSLRGFHYCDLILAPAERAAWKVVPSFSSWTLGTPTGIESSDMRSDDELKPITTLAHAERAAE